MKIEKSESVCFCCHKSVSEENSVKIDGKIVCIKHKGVDKFATMEYLKKQKDKVDAIEKKEKKGN